MENFQALLVIDRAVAVEGGKLPQKKLCLLRPEIRVLRRFTINWRRITCLREAFMVKNKGLPLSGALWYGFPNQRTSAQSLGESLLSTARSRLCRLFVSFQRTVQRKLLNHS